MSTAHYPRLACRVMALCERAANATLDGASSSDSQVVLLQIFTGALSVGSCETWYTEELIQTIDWHAAAAIAEEFSSRY
jgi:hypothetical protein